MVQPSMLDTLDALKARGVTRAAFRSDGTLESVEFGPIATDQPVDVQHEAPKAPRRVSATGGLVPRAGSSD